MTFVLSLISFLLFLFFLLLIGRLVLEWIQMFARDWHPKGPVLVIAEGVYTVTDPPVRAVRRVVPPLRLGGVQLDLSLLILLILVSILRGPGVSLLANIL